MHSAARCLLYSIYLPCLFTYLLCLLGFSLAGTQEQQSAIKPFLTNEKAADKSENHSCSHKGESFICRPAIAASYDPGHRRVEGFDVLQALSHTIHDLINVFAVVQGGAQPSPKELLDDSG